MEDKILAVIKEPFQKPRTEYIDKGLDTLQKIVQGTITTAYLPEMDDVFGYCNDEGLFIGMQPNIYRPEYGDGIVGPLVFVGDDGYGGDTSLTPEQVKKVTDYLEQNHVSSRSEFIHHIQTGFADYKPKKQSCM